MVKRKSGAPAQPGERAGPGPKPESKRAKDDRARVLRQQILKEYKLSEAGCEWSRHHKGDVCCKTHRCSAVYALAVGDQRFVMRDRTEDTATEAAYQQADGRQGKPQRSHYLERPVLLRARFPEVSESSEYEVPPEPSTEDVQRVCQPFFLWVMNRSYNFLDQPGKRTAQFITDPVRKSRMDEHSRDKQTHILNWLEDQYRYGIHLPNPGKTPVSILPWRRRKTAWNECCDDLLSEYKEEALQWEEEEKHPVHIPHATCTAHDEAPTHKHTHCCRTLKMATRMTRPPGIDFAAMTSLSELGGIILGCLTAASFASGCRLLSVTPVHRCAVPWTRPATTSTAKASAPISGPT